MAARRGGTSAVRWRRPRRHNLKCRRASRNAGEPSALANREGGGLWQRGHDDGVRGGAPVSLCTALTLTEREWRAREEATGCWGDGGAIAVAKEQRGRAGDGYGDGGGAGRARLSLRRGRRSRKWEMKRGATRADAGGVKAAPRRVVAWLGRAEATRGRFSSTRRPRPDGGRPLKPTCRT